MVFYFFYIKFSFLTLIFLRYLVTGLSQGYGFVTFDNPKSTREAYRDANEMILDDHVILVDYERSRKMLGWIPRRFGGGYGGKKESGQLRFGARDRPFRDNHGKIKIQYQQKRSDVWREDESSKRSNEHSHSDRRDNSHNHNDRSLHRSSRRRSPSPEHRSTRRRTSDRYHHSDSKRKRQDSLQNNDRRHR